MPSTRAPARSTSATAGPGVERLRRGPGAQPVATGGGFPGHYGPSGVAYDPDDDAIWVANYQGAPRTAGTSYGFNEYGADGALLQAYPTLSAGPHEEPYSIAVCPKSATGGATIVVVGYIDDGSLEGTGGVEAYEAGGGPLGGPIHAPLERPYALSCDPSGVVYIADATGLYQEQTVTSQGLSAATPASPGVHRARAAHLRGAGRGRRRGAGRSGPGRGGRRRRGQGSPDAGTGPDGSSAGDAGLPSCAIGDRTVNPTANCMYQASCDDGHGNPIPPTFVSCFPYDDSPLYMCAEGADGGVENVCRNYEAGIPGAPGCCENNLGVVYKCSANTTILQGCTTQ